MNLFGVFTSQSLEGRSSIHPNLSFDSFPKIKLNGISYVLIIALNAGRAAVLAISPERNGTGEQVSTG